MLVVLLLFSGFALAGQLITVHKGILLHQDTLAQAVL